LGKKDAPDGLNNLGRIRTEKKPAGVTPSASPCDCRLDFRFHRNLTPSLERDGDRVRMITRGGYNWTDRYPWIVEAAGKIRQRQFVLDGEAVVLGVDGISDFNALHSRKHDDEVQFCAFDILVEGGDDLRKLPLSMRKTNSARLLARRSDGIFAAPFEQGEIGPDLFRAACNMGLEGLVSKRRDRPYRGGGSPHWVKVKNRTHPAMNRVRDAFS
jgi:bifunctional non-homologous end joining protein LigD